MSKRKNKTIGRSVERRGSLPQGRQLFLAFIAYCLLTGLFAGPLILRPGSLLYGHELVGFNIDPYAEMDGFSAIRQAFLNGQGLPFSLFLHPAVAYPGAWLTGLWNEVAAFNILLLLSFPLAGFFCYLLAFYLTGHSPASFYAGCLYAYSPYHWIHAYYHLSLAQIQWFPLYLLSLFLFIKRGSLPRAGLLLLSLALLVFANYYYALFALLLTVFFLVYQGSVLWCTRRGEGGMGRSFGFLLLLLFSAAALFLVLLGPEIVYVYRHLPALSARYGDLFRYSSRAWGFVFPPLDNPFLGWIGRSYILSRLEGGTLVEHTLYPGIVPVSLAILASWRRGEKEDRRGPGLASHVLCFHWLLIALALVFSLPPVITLGRFSLSLPSYYLYQVLPMFRSYARFGLLIYLALAVLSAGGLARISGRFPSKKWPTLLLVLLLFLEYTNIPPWRNRPVEPRVLKSQSAAGRKDLDFSGKGFEGRTETRRQ